MNTPKEVLDFASECVGQKEINGNKGFEDQRFQTLMKQVGWEFGQAWCSYQGELIWTVPTYSGKSKLLESMQKCFSANAVRTFENFSKYTDLYKVDKIPRPGAIGIYARYKDSKPVKIGSWTLGHLVFVESVKNSEKFNTIEGNTNDQGGAEGEVTARRIRDLDFSIKERGLILLGFVIPKEWI